METYEKIKELRKKRHISQEEMAEKMNMSSSGYRKIESGVSRITQERLQQMADILGVSPFELMPNNWGNGHSICQIGDTSHQVNSFYSHAENSVELEMLKQQLALKDEIISEKNKMIEKLDKIIQLLEKNQSN